MLRITNAREIAGRHRVEVQGRLAGPGVAELQKVASGIVACAEALVVDLSAVTSVDAAGIRLLRDLVGAGAGIEGATPYVAELLGREEEGSHADGRR